MPPADGRSQDPVATSHLGFRSRVVGLVQTIQASWSRQWLGTRAASGENRKVAFFGLVDVGSPSRNLEIGTTHWLNLTSYAVVQVSSLFSETMDQNSATLVPKIKQLAVLEIHHLIHSDKHRHWLTILRILGLVLSKCTSSFARNVSAHALAACHAIASTFSSPAAICRARAGKKTTVNSHVLWPNRSQFQKATPELWFEPATWRSKSSMITLVWRNIYTYTQFLWYVYSIYIYIYIHNIHNIPTITLFFSYPQTPNKNGRPKGPLRSWLINPPRNSFRFAASLRPRCCAARTCRGTGGSVGALALPCMAEDSPVLMAIYGDL